MTNRRIDVARRAADSSALIRAIRPVIASSAVCAAVVAALQGIRRMRERILVGLGSRWSAERASDTSLKLDALASGSRLIGGLSAVFNVLSIAWAEGGMKRWADPIVGVTLLERIRMSGFIITTAVITHSILLAQLGVPVREVGWGIRALLLAAGLFAVKQPAPFAAAWINRTARLRKGRCK